MCAHKEFITHRFFFLNIITKSIYRSFPSGSDSKESACNVGALDSIPGSRRSLGEGNSYPLQYFCWKMLWTEEPDRVQSMGSQRIGHDWVTNTFTFHFSSVYVQFSSVAQSCLTLCDPMNHSTPGIPVHHQHPESTQTRVHWISAAIQPPHPLLSPSPPALNLSQLQDLFIGYLLTWGDHHSVSYIFAFSYCSRGSWGTNI